MNTITITLTPDAQRAALLAGLPAAITQTYTVEPTDLPALLALPQTMVAVAPDGTVTATLPERLGYQRGMKPEADPAVGYIGWGAIPSALDARPASAAAAIAAAQAAIAAWREKVAAQAAEEKETEARQEAERIAKATASEHAARAWGALPLADRLTADGGLNTAGIGYHHMGYPRYARDELSAYAPVALAEADAELAARKAATAAAGAAAVKIANAEKYAARLASGYWERETESYNERRHGSPWCAQVSFPSGATPVYSWGESTGKWGKPGLMRVPCVPGDVIAWGQKDMRRPDRSDHTIARMRADGSMEEMTATEAFRAVTAAAKVTA